MAQRTPLQLNNYLHSSYCYKRHSQRNKNLAPTYQIKSLTSHRLTQVAPTLVRSRADSTRHRCLKGLPGFLPGVLSMTWPRQGQKMEHKATTTPIKLRISSLHFPLTRNEKSQNKRRKRLRHRSYTKAIYSLPQE